MRSRGKVGALIAACWALCGAAQASDVEDAVAVVHRFTQTTDRELYGALCTADAVVIDHVPPYVLPGPHACRKDWDAVLAWAQETQLEVADYGTPGEPEFVDVRGDSLYMVFPVTASGTRLGKAFFERGKYTFVLRREGGGWRIAAAIFSTSELTIAK